MSRKTTLLAACTALGLLATGSSASAQPGAYAPPPPPPPQPQVERAPDPPRWGIGLRTTSMEIVNAGDEDSDTAVELAGAGLHLRYRLADHWRAELTFEGTTTDPDDAVVRESAMASLSLQYIFNPRSKWNWYVLGGVGAVESTVTQTSQSRVEFEETFEERHLQLGLGLERRFRRVSIGAELRGAGLERDDEAADGVNYAGVDGPIPMESSAGMFNLHATYYF